MESELKRIKSLRRLHGLTQAELARLSGVSQSLIAKTEAGTLDPAFSRAKKILDVLESLGREKEARAKDVMVTRVHTSSPADTVADAVKAMHSHGISQIPVVERGAVVGLVSEGIILELMVSGRKDPSAAAIAEVMQDAPPVVSEQTRIGAIMPLLKHFPLVVVTRKGALAGIITKADMLKAFSA